MLPERTEILIVGAGPTGLALAIALQDAGLGHILIDALPHAQDNSRAAVIHAHTLEALNTLGVTDALKECGLELSQFTIRDRDQPLMEIGFDGLPSEHRLLMIPQTTTEAVLADRLVQLGGRIYRNVTALGAWQDLDEGLVRVPTADGEQTIQARYIVGGDGMHSAMRKAADIPFDGDAYGESFVLADVRMEWPLGATEVSLFFAPAGLVVLAPLPDGSFRIVATLEDAPELPAAGDIQKLLDTRGPSSGGCRVREIIWSSRFRVHHRLAATYRKGPFLLMGDAAHVHSPAGGQGMNCGLVDAVVLGSALKAVIQDGASPEILDHYAAIRRPAAEGVLALAGRLTKLATIESAPKRVLRNFILRTLNKSSRFRAWVAMNLSGLSRKHLSVLPDRHFSAAA
ncbi:MAG: FAD-dependent monooxygenase [Sphingosinicella sp.]|nr:FAD-dependent monooxygenase [Sphingosinicella sp.]